MLDWKNTSGGETALLIDGARRVGKSYIVKKFAENEYASHIFIDFNNIKSDLKEILDTYLSDLDTLFNYLSIYFGVSLLNRKSAIIFDEVQLYPKVRGAIKYLVADGRYDYIETGSLVSIKKNVKDIVIPSEEEHIEMFPMDFEEFLMANGDSAIWDYITMCYQKRQPLGPLFQKINKKFREYLVVGGMPQAVKAYVEGKDFTAIDKIKSNILALYRADIAKYADGQEVKVTAIFDDIPSQLNRHEKKFRMSDLKSTARLRDYESAFFWLSDSMVINIAYNTTEPNIGLKMNLDRTSLKCYMGDTGLLITMANSETRGGENDLYRKIITNKLEVNYGMVIENVVSQMLRAAGHKLFFFSSYSKASSDDRMEIDFLIRNRDVTSRHNIRPLEVKSTVKYTITSLNKFASKYGSYISSPTVIHPADYKEQDGVVYLPLCMTPLL